MSRDHEHYRVVDPLMLEPVLYEIGYKDGTLLRSPLWFWEAPVDARVANAMREIDWLFWHEMVKVEIEKNSVRVREVAEDDRTPQAC